MGANSQASGWGRKVTVRVPATAANLGAGFDVIGIALDIYNLVTVEESDRFSVVISGEGAATISRGEDNRVYQGIWAVYKKAGQPVPPLLLRCENNIPLARGLGSSAAALVAGLIAGNFLCGQPLSREEILRMGAELEGHADNIAPAVLGGCQIVVQEGQRLVHAPVPVPPQLKGVLFIPDFEMPTEESRALLPSQISRKDAVYNLGRVALLVNALATGQLQYLRVATQDRLHQPARQSLFPAMSSFFEAALEAGAWGVFLSGGGPTILALTTDREEDIGKALLSTAQKAGINGKIRTACPSPVGAHLGAED